MPTQQEYKDLSDSDKKKEDWMNAKWRPMMGWMYMAVCACDFMLFPILWSLHQALNHGQVSSQWQPLTLQGAGLFHIAMGAVLGLAAYGRTQEKLAGANNGGAQLGTTYTPPTPTSGGFGSTPSFGSAPSTGGFGSGFAGTTPAPTVAPAANAFGQKVVPQAAQPML
jgi:hypothetical protein